MSKFKVWIDDNKVMTGDAGNVMTSDVLNADVQRINGFKSGTDVSSQRVNSMIRQNSLVSKALMDISGDNTLDATSAVSDVINILKKSDNHIVNFTQASALSNITSGEKLSTSFGKINKQFDTLGTFMKADESGVKLYASSDTAKGTIEERLTNLGFKQGSVNLASGVTASKNTITRQGNYCILTLGIVRVPSKYNTDILIGTISSDFLPKEKVSQSTYSLWDSGSSPDVYRDSVVSIYKNGEIKVMPNVVTDTGDIYTKINFLGYEAEPITNN